MARAPFWMGNRGSAVSVALLRDGVPILGVVHAPLSPDRGPDTIAWTDGAESVTRNGQPVPRLKSGCVLSADEIVGSVKNLGQVAVCKVISLMNA